jgi:hypothetical protein
MLQLTEHYTAETNVPATFRAAMTTLHVLAGDSLSVRHTHHRVSNF